MSDGPWHDYSDSEPFDNTGDVIRTYGELGLRVTGWDTDGRDRYGTRLLRVYYTSEEGEPRTDTYMEEDGT